MPGKITRSILSALMVTLVFITPTLARKVVDDGRITAEIPANWDKHDFAYLNEGHVALSIVAPPAKDATKTTKSSITVIHYNDKFCPDVDHCIKKRVDKIESQIREIREWIKPPVEEITTGVLEIAGLKAACVIITGWLNGAREARSTNIHIIVPGQDATNDKGMEIVIRSPEHQTAEESNHIMSFLHSLRVK